MIYYFAYGSNLHPIRLIERVPSAELIGVAKHFNHTLTFHKKSHDGSGKCNMHFTNDHNDRVPAVIYELHTSEKILLDAYESVGKGYNIHDMHIQGHKEKHKVFTYLADPERIAAKNPDANVSPTGGPGVVQYIQARPQQQIYTHSR